MHPAFSVIFLTTLIGAGQGLFLALYTGQLYSVVEVVPVEASHSHYGIGTLIALLLLVAGLFSSFFHLGRPERAWRSAAMWRTSWLSREVIALPAFMGMTALYGLVHISKRQKKNQERNERGKKQKRSEEHTTKLQTRGQHT